MELLEVVLIISAGVLSGLINTLASSGSAVSLPALMMLGLTAPVANGTNRIAILLGTITAVIKLGKEGMIDWSQAVRLGIPVLVGSVVGAFIATQLDARSVGEAVVIAVIMAFVMILMNPKRLIHSVSTIPHVKNWHYIILFFVGLWGGFIVLDSATYLLLSMVLLIGYDLLRGNGMKNLMLLPITVGSLFVFWYEHEINWEAGLWLSIGSVVGSWVGGYLASREQMKVWMFRLLITVIVGEILH